MPGSVFAQAVANDCKRMGWSSSLGEVQSDLTASRVFRALTVGATSGDPNRAVTIDQAALNKLAANGPSYLPNRPVAL